MADITMSRPGGAGDLLRRRCEDLVAAEMARLARRAPVLRGAQLSQVETALRQLTDGLVLHRADLLSSGQLAVLFDLPDAPLTAGRAVRRGGALQGGKPRQDWPASLWVPG
jgi:hypothetical protein